MALSTDPLERRLQLLHLAQPRGQPPLCPALLRGLRLAGQHLPSRWRHAQRDKGRALQLLHGSPQWRAFVAAFDRFVAHVVAPQCVRRRPRGANGAHERRVDGGRDGDPSGSGCGSSSSSSSDEGEGEGAHDGDDSVAGATRPRLAYQRPPTVRVHTPGFATPIGLHCDADYPGHEGGEINVWVPLTRAVGSSALWLESSPGAADFAPVELGYGELLVFNGCRCRHYAMANRTGATRVSFDLRAIPADVWRDDYFGKIGDYPAAVL